MQGAITKRMTAIEEMAGMDVLCSDKTGTLTLNKLTVDKNLIEVTHTWPCFFFFFYKFTYFQKHVRVWVSLSVDFSLQCVQAIWFASH